jgi:hypothetical protein
MTNIQELIESADHLCASLDKAAQDEKRFCNQVLHELERMSWETLRMANDLKHIKEYAGGK